MKRSLILVIFICVSQIFSSCKTRSTSEEEQMPLASVKVTPLTRGSIEKEISFNGRTLYLKKNQINSPISGYVVKANVKFGQEVRKDEVLFEIQTRESKALETDKGVTGEFGTVKVPATSGGYINELNINEPGVYVAEGNNLCTIVDYKDLMIRVNVPFENNSVLIKERKCIIRLPDNTIISGSVSRILPVMDEASQTQTVFIIPATSRQLPENLNLTISFVVEKHQEAMLVTKSSLMTNETQSEFWVMKVTDGNLAVEIPVKTGIMNDTIAEVISPDLKVNDLIISEGAYGLPDSTSIRIVQ